MAQKKDRITVTHLLKMKRKGEKITALTSYEFLFTKILDSVGIDIILVGDSLGNIFQGHTTTLPVTIDEMVYHTRIVSRAAEHSLVVGDMPFMSYQVSREEALRNAGSLMKESGAHAVKIEGGREWASLVKDLVTIGIPVLGHVGLTPQSVHALGGFKVQGRTDADRIIEDASALEDSGAFAVVLEAIPKDLARRITETLKIPTIGIGAGPYCDGQILVTQDMLGLFERFRPKFVRAYAQLAIEIRTAVSTYISDVRSGDFPCEDESYD